jgi:hypothetical protein
VLWNHNTTTIDFNNPSSPSIRSFTMTGDYPRDCPIQEILSFLPHLEHFSVHQMLPVGLPENSVAWDSVCDTLNLLGQGIRHLELTLSDYAWDLGYQYTDIQQECDHCSSAPLKHNYKLSANLHDMSSLKSLHLGSELVFLHFYERDCYGPMDSPRDDTSTYTLSTSFLARCSTCISRPSFPISPTTWRCTLGNCNICSLILSSS